MAKRKVTKSQPEVTLGNRQVLDVVKAVSYEMEVDKEVIFEAIEAALEIVTAKRYLYNIDVKVVINRDTGDYQSFRCWTVVDENETEDFNPEKHLTLEQARKHNKALQIGDVIKEPIESVEFGRIAIQTVKHTILNKVREAKKAKIVDSYASKLHELIHGSVKKIVREGIILDVGDEIEVIIPREEMLAGENVHIGDRLRAYLYEIDSSARGLRMLASRAKKEMLDALFRLEVPEIGDETIQIKAIARDPGSRSKVAVATNDGRIDPVGACVGMRGARIQVISNELSGERVDVILWDPNPAQLVINSMSPAEVVSIVMDEDAHSMDISVDQAHLSQAIGRNGQNVKLASELTGWTLNVMSTEDFKNKNAQESEKITKMFMEKLDVDESVAAILVREGFMSVEEIAYVPTKELTSIEEFDEELVEELRERAKAAAAKESEQKKPADDLLKMPGMDKQLAYELAKNGIKTMKDLAELSVDELLDIDEDIDEDRARKLIMKAREPWFT